MLARVTNSPEVGFTKLRDTDNKHHFDVVSRASKAQVSSCKTSYKNITFK